MNKTEFNWKLNRITPLRISALIWLWKEVRRPQVGVQWKVHTAQRKCNPCCDWLHPVSVNIVIPRHLHRLLHALTKEKTKTLNVRKIENNPNYLWWQPSALTKIYSSLIFSFDRFQETRQAFSTFSFFNKDPYLLAYSRLRSSPYTLIYKSEKNITPNHHHRMFLWSSSLSVSYERFFSFFVHRFILFFLTNKYVIFRKNNNGLTMSGTWPWASPLDGKGSE